MIRIYASLSEGTVAGVSPGVQVCYRVRMMPHVRNLYGPWRDTLAKAEADLARARACDDKEGLLRRLMLEAGKEGGRGEGLRKGCCVGRRGERRGDAREEAQAPEAMAALEG